MRHSSYRDNRQRFHKGREGSLLVPHNAIAGLLFTVNPRQDAKARREAQLYLNGLTEDLQSAQQRYLATTKGTRDGGADGSSTDESHEDDSGGVDSASRCERSQHATTASLLAAELAEAREDAGKKRPRQGDGSDDEGEKGGAKKGKPALSQAWFASLETSCKGYMLLNIPTVNPTVTCVVGRAGGGTDAAAVEDKADKEKGGAERLPPHSIVVNPLVSHVVEKVFANLLRGNASPMFRHCFRLTPAELTCCPTPAEMQQAVKLLLGMHFPPAAQPTTPEAHAESAASSISFDKPICVAEPASHLPQSSEPKKAKHMFTVALSFNVKNNTNVEAKKAQFQTQLQSAIPMNRFIVVPASLLAQKKVTVDAVLCVHVIHATCLMGVQRLYHERRGYNLHDLSEERLELSNSVVATAKADHP